MHKYLRAVGFSDVKSRSQLNALIMDVLQTAGDRNYTTISDKAMLALFSKEFAPRAGLSICGEFDDQDEFTFEYIYPYFKSSVVSSMEDISVERHAEKDSYAGVVDELKVGVSLIFYLQNIISYIKLQRSDMIPIRGTTLSLSALSLSGTILLPLQKSQKDREIIKKERTKRIKLIAQARNGNEEAIEELSVDEMNTYNSINKKLAKEDVFSLVDTYFMPYGVECDQYNILAEILECRTVENHITGETLEQMVLMCNDLVFDLCINKKDLLGEPMPGRRFRGSIWLQGKINFPQ